MSNIMIVIGWFGLAVGGVYYYVHHRLGGTLHLGYFESSEQILTISAVLVVGGYLLKYLPRKLGVGLNRCKKCGKLIEKTEMFCFDHRIEVIRQAQDRGRTIAP